MTEEHRIPPQRNSVDAQRNDRFSDRERNGGGCRHLGIESGLGNDTLRSGIIHQRCEDRSGRFNFFDYRGASVIADYGHNPDAMHALVSAVESIKANKRVVVISGAGDRRDVDIIRQTEILGDAFDEIILYQDQCQRGRENGEVLALLRKGLTNAKRAKYIDRDHR